MRRFLDGLYALSAAAAALSLALIALVILSQTILRPLGVVVPSGAEISGYIVAATTFLALAPTFRAGGHIRVSLLIRTLPVSFSRAIEIWCLGVGTGLAGFLTWNLFAMAAKSFSRHSVSPGLLGVPIWIPQITMVIGGAIFVICLLDCLVSVIRGEAAPYEDAPDEAGSLSEV
jgi:TRAP-type C4-dicarboxylate transport system permease small subunit